MKQCKDCDEYRTRVQLISTGFRFKHECDCDVKSFPVACEWYDRKWWKFWRPL